MLQGNLEMLYKQYMMKYLIQTFSEEMSYS